MNYFNFLLLKSPVYTSGTSIYSGRSNDKYSYKSFILLDSFHLLNNTNLSSKYLL